MENFQNERDNERWVLPGNPYRGKRLSTVDLLVPTSLDRGRLSTVDLLAPTSLDQRLLIVKTLFPFFTKQTTLMRRSTVLSLSLQLVFPGITQK